MNIIDNNKDNEIYIYNQLNNNISFNVEDYIDEEFWGNIAMGYIYYTVLYPLFDKFKCKSIIDLGCGSGNVLRYAKNIGYETTGIDFIDYSDYNKDHKFIQANLKEIDYSILKNYDVIYTAMPLKVGKGFEEYIDEICNNMNIGQYIITPLWEIKKDNFKQICSNTWIKI